MENFFFSISHLLTLDSTYKWIKLKKKIFSKKLQQGPPLPLQKNKCWIFSCWMLIDEKSIKKFFLKKYPKSVTYMIGMLKPCISLIVLRYIP